MFYPHGYFSMLSGNVCFDVDQVGVIQNGPVLIQWCKPKGLPSEFFSHSFVRNTQLNIVAQKRLT